MGCGSCTTWWERSTGERIATLTPHTRDSIAHLLHNLTPTLDRLAPTGDHARDSTAALFDYHRQYLQTLIALYPQERLSAMARKSALDLLHRAAHALQLRLLQRLSSTPFPRLPAASAVGAVHRLLGPGHRPADDALGLGHRRPAFANFICGPYTESHAHRDQGSFVLFKRQLAGLWTANITSTSGIEQGEENHNLVRLFRADGSVDHPARRSRSPAGCWHWPTTTTTPTRWPTSRPSTAERLRGPTA